MAQANRPTIITGGCACGEVRYSVDYTKEDAIWPPKVHTCQCGLCRKSTGAVLPHIVEVRVDIIKLPLEPTPHYKTYKSSFHGSRTFCGNCGGTMTFQTTFDQKNVHLHVGSLDEEYLVGERIEDEQGRVIERRGGFSGQFVIPSTNLYMENAIKGFTDEILGKRYMTFPQKYME